VNATPLAGARLNASIAHLMTARGSVLEATTTHDDFGHDDEAWTPLAGHEDLACLVGPVSYVREEVTAGTAVVHKQQVKVLVNGHHPEVQAETHRWRSGGSDWRIVAVLPDALASFTELLCELVTPGV
jgi:hypothetical protein